MFGFHTVSRNLLKPSKQFAAKYRLLSCRTIYQQHLPCTSATPSNVRVTSITRPFSTTQYCSQAQQQDLGPRDSMFYDVLIVGAGPAGLSAAIVCLKQVLSLFFIAYSFVACSA